MTEKESREKAIMILNKKRATRPAQPTNDGELLAWLYWHNNHDNIYAWDFDFLFLYNGHTVESSGLFGHICIDGIQHRITNFLESAADVDRIYNKLAYNKK